MATLDGRTHQWPDTGRAELAAAVDTLAVRVRRLASLMAFETGHVALVDSVSLIPFAEEDCNQPNRTPADAPPLEDDTIFRNRAGPISSDCDTSSEIATGILHLQQRLGGFLKR